ncbi:FlgK family flagellar hook-associated protein, partial [Burkholderia pseudomallei]
MTTGYTRQVAEISTIGASGGSPNSAGNGVQVDSIRRVSNQYQVNQVWYAASDYGYYSTQQGYLTQLEAVLSDDNSSLSGGFDNFFAALNEATTSPDDSALREQVISEAGALSLRIDNTLDYIDSQ